MDQRGQRGRYGKGHTTGHQNSKAALTKQTCSTLCQPDERRASSNAAGICHPHRVDIIKIQHAAGAVSRCAILRNGIQWRNGTMPSRATDRGSPRKSGRTGEPNRSRGGVNMSNKMCCTICAESSRPDKASSGELTASQKETKPARNESKRHRGNKAGVMRCRIVHPLT